MLIKDPKERRRVAEIKYLRALFWLLGWKYTSSEILRSLLSPRGVARLRKFGLIETQKKYFASVIQLSSFGWKFTSQLFLSSRLLDELPPEHRKLAERMTRRNKKSVNWGKLHHDLEVQKTVLKLLRGKIKPYTLKRYKDFEYDEYNHLWDTGEIIEEWEEVEHETPGTYLSEYSLLRVGLQPAPDAIFISFNEKVKRPSFWGVEYESGQNKNLQRITTKITSVVKNSIIENRLLNGVIIYGSRNNYRKALKNLRENSDGSEILFSPHLSSKNKELYKQYYDMDLLELYHGTVRGYEFYQPQPQNALRDLIYNLSASFWPYYSTDFDRELLGKLFTHLK